MSPLLLDGPDRLAMRRGEVVIAIPVYGAHERFVSCLRSVISHTPVEVPVLVLDDASPDERSRELLVDLDADGVIRHTLQYVRHDENRGFVATANEAFDRADPADVVIVNSDCVVTAGWLTAMTEAAVGSLVATVSVFTNNGTIVSLPERNRPGVLPQALDIDHVGRAIRGHSLTIRPRLPTAIGHCLLVKRAALNLVGRFDTSFSPGYGEEVDFSQRCVQRGLVHVLADDAFVFHAGAASFQRHGLGGGIRHKHERMIAGRYGYYPDWTSEFARSTSGPFARALGVAVRSLRSPSVTIDATSVGPVVTGTQVHTLELIAALSRDERVALRAIVSNSIGDHASAVLRGLEGVEVVAMDAGRTGAGRTDVVHRPMQVTSFDDLDRLREMGERIVITHQDLISYGNPGYFSSFDDWSSYRRLARHSLAFADRVIFFSHSAADEALAEELVTHTNSDVVYIGTDHAVGEAPSEERAPEGFARLSGRPYLLCLGTDFLHKNRVFALRVLEALRRAHGFPGGLVFAGPHVPIGSSSGLESEFLLRHPELGESVVDVAAVDAGEKRWLMRHAALMLYPTVHEGFGLVPFESADMGLVCAFASTTSIGELLPRKLALIEDWDAEATAARLADYLASVELRAEHVAAVQAAGARFTWRATATALVDIYQRSLTQPFSESRVLADDVLEERRQFAALREHYQRLRTEYDTTAQGLVGANGVIPPELRRPLLAVGKRPLLRGLTFGIIRVLYAVAYRLRHGGRAPDG